MTDTATLTARLAEAQDALHKLRTGALVVRVKTETEEVSYASTDQAQLSAYIRDLERQLGTGRSRAIRPIFR